MAYGIQSPGKGLIVKTIFSTLFFKININYGTKREEKKNGWSYRPFPIKLKDTPFLVCLIELWIQLIHVQCVS